MDPKPFVSTKSADDILASIARFAQRTVDAQAAQHMSRTNVTAHWFAVEQTGMSQGNILELTIVLILILELALFFLGIMT
jgi:hypothetical protein